MRKAVTSDRGAKAQAGPLRPVSGRRVHGHRRLIRGTAATALATALALIVTLVIPAGGAQAVDYPSWQDVQNAKSNTAAASAKVTEIQNLISNLQTQVAQTQAESEKRGAELRVAQENYDEATRRASDLQAQADASKATADAATKQAGQLAAQLYRTGGTDLTVNLLLDGEASGTGADALLAKLGSMSKMVERSTGVYEEAQAATNSAQSLGDQAKIAQTERERLNVAAQAAMAAAQAAAEAAANALAESESKSVELAAQLAFMQDAQASTTAGYEAGVAERARLAAIEAARIAAEAAAAAAANRGNSGGGGGGSSPGAGLGGGYISSQGWAVPASGRITDGYGPRAVICGSSCSKGFHSGTDIGASCGSPIYAAHDGVVTYAGPNGTYGNYIQINNGGGVSTGYAHIRSGGTFVSNGQSVSAGQNIASVGMTGAADGCHLHFEVRVNGPQIDPQPFMASRGAPLG
ncbi:peptidoglycan DD-metalloendopeptidase family protein [Cryobacterium zhongshanensis]|uniref:Peptidoglycan DD-metalloendopeptidase family protein n=1 Tax=Cryobacterium zhongshanensis TaxID=2928153 RepID=A0AA41UH59_9MICO|nr:M23 family metallopeptidase [Cryobacterium zhongshanensis]MCI4658044.1 peptidoglycan DD-metalloendopeptidase family protein [Cryobacterium zhongshanensis]